MVYAGILAHGMWKNLWQTLTCDGALDGDCGRAARVVACTLVQSAAVCMLHAQGLQYRHGCQQCECPAPQVGLNGVDNGAIRFSHVRVPRENLLNRFASVNRSGQYSSPLPSEVGALHPHTYIHCCTTCGSGMLRHCSRVPVLPAVLCMPWCCVATLADLWSCCQYYMLTVPLAACAVPALCCHAG